MLCIRPYVGMMGKDVKTHKTSSGYLLEELRPAQKYESEMISGNRNHG